MHGGDNKLPFGSAQARHMEMPNDAETGLPIGKIDSANEQGHMKLYGDVEVEEFSLQEQNQVKRKIDFILLPLLCGCYVFSVR